MCLAPDLVKSPGILDISAWSTVVVSPGGYVRVLERYEVLGSNVRLRILYSSYFFVVMDYFRLE